MKHAPNKRCDMSGHRDITHDDKRKEVKRIITNPSYPGLNKHG